MPKRAPGTLCTSLRSEVPRAAIAAASNILERLEGRPVQPPVEDENDQRRETRPAGWIAVMQGL